MIETLGRVDESLVYRKGYSVEAGEEMMTRLLEQHPDVEAVFCINNLVFFGSAGPVNLFELREGRQIMMAGFDISHYSSLLKRPLISADQNLGRLAEAAVGLLLNPEASGKDIHKTIPVSIVKHRLP